MINEISAANKELDDRLYSVREPDGVDVFKLIVFALISIPLTIYEIYREKHDKINLLN